MEPDELMSTARRYELCCWDCQEPLDEADAVRVKAVPSVPNHVSASTTKVCRSCADMREMTA